MHGIRHGTGSKRMGVVVAKRGVYGGAPDMPGGVRKRRVPRNLKGMKAKKKG